MKGKKREIREKNRKREKKLKRKEDEENVFGWIRKEIGIKKKEKEKQKGEEKKKRTGERKKRVPLISEIYKNQTVGFRWREK